MYQTTSKRHFGVKKERYRRVYTVCYCQVGVLKSETYSQACLCLENAGKAKELWMWLPWEGALETPLNFLLGACVTFIIFFKRL